ncbi:MAG: hypothetical protein PHG27_01265 [Massilibacteroides sp.]|nr:hypothetical protein [Massilibacteroides sp.]MDD4114216.1 hypothetical protein [Massilibacteroides sp.]MDD4661175.1 hypothetical protein [Massilibacteroides sp.]
MEIEYENIFSHEEYTGFTVDSIFFTLLHKACMEIREPRLAYQKEWVIARYLMPEKTSYRFEDGVFTSYTSWKFPLNSIEKIYLSSFRQRKEEYTAFIGFLRQKGLKPEKILAGFK